MGSHKDSSRGQRRADQRKKVPPDASGLQQTPAEPQFAVPPPMLTAWPEGVQLNPIKLSNGKPGVLFIVGSGSLVIQMPTSVDAMRQLAEGIPSVCEAAERLASDLWTPEQGAAPDPATIAQTQDHIKNGGNPT